MEKSHKLNKLTYYEDRTRHREFRSLSTRQLEVDTRKLRRSATKDEKGGKFDDADRKRRDVSAMETIINQRKGGNPQSRAMKQFGQNYFLSQMAGGITPLFGRGGGYAQGAGRMGMNAYGALRAGGQGKGMAIGGGIAAMLLGPLIKSFKDVKDAQKAVAGAGSFVGSGTGDGMASRFNNNMDHYSGQMTGMGLDRVDLAKGMGSFAKTGIYGGTSQEGLMHGVMAEHATEKALGLSSQIQQSYAKTGMYGDRQDNESALLGFSRFLESKGIGDVKVGIAPDGTVGDRNLTRVPEYLKRLVELNDQMFKVTGDKSKSQQNAAQNFMGSILGLGGIFSKTGDMAGETASGIRNSFANPKDALAQYKNIRAYRQGTGKTGVVGMMEAFENMDDPRVINQLMKSMAGERGISGQN